MELSSFIITNTYVPNIPKKRKRSFQKLETHIKNNNNNILGGDFNMVERKYTNRQSRCKSDDTTLWFGIYQKH